MSLFVPYPEEFAEKYKKKGYWAGLTLGEAFDDVAAVFPNKEALVSDERRLSYSQLKNETDRLAVSFLNSGLKPRDRVIVQLPNIAEFVCCYYALLKIGVIPVMCLPQHRFSEISYIAKQCEARGYIIPDFYRKFDYLEFAEEVKEAVPSLQYVYVAGEKCPEGYFSLREMLQEETDAEQINELLEKNKPDPMDVAVFLLSGGTTGLPKVIPRTHNDYLYTAKATALPSGLSKYSVYLAIAPLAHNMTLACPGISGTFLNGGKVVLVERVSLESMCEVIDKEKVTIVGLVPALIIGLLNYEKRGEYDLSSLAGIVSGGSKLNPEVAKRIKPELGCNLLQQFGMAEGVLMMTDDTSDEERVIFETIGRPVSPADEIRIVDENGLDVPPGEVGEMICRGPYTIRGYYNAPEHNKTAFTEDGFYRSGDLMKMDVESGCYIVDGRIKDMINRGGENISAEELDNLILSHPKVKNGAVVAMPDPVLGEKCCAYVVLKENQSLDLPELNSFLLDKQIAKFKLPERLEIVDELPLTNVGKVSKRELKIDIEEKIKRENAAKE